MIYPIAAESAKDGAATTARTMDPIASFRSALRGLHEGAWGALARRRFREEIERVETVCLFVGYPRSGHSLVGAFLDAHRHAVVAHELDAASFVLGGCSREVLFSRMLARSHGFHLRGNAGKYPYRVPRQWQGRFESLRVIGDKRGGALTRAIAAHADLLDRIRALVRVPIRLVHVVRNPWDNVAAISIDHGLSLAESADYYDAHCRTTARLGELCDASELLTIRHEDVVAAPRAVLEGLCSFVGLDAPRDYLDDCASIVFPAPTGTRHRVAWTPALVRDLESRVRAYRHLDGYGLEPTETTGEAVRA